MTQQIGTLWCRKGILWSWVLMSKLCVALWIRLMNWVICWKLLEVNCDIFFLHKKYDLEVLLLTMSIYIIWILISFLISKKPKQDTRKESKTIEDTLTQLQNFFCYSGSKRYVLCQLPLVKNWCVSSSFCFFIL